MSVRQRLERRMIPVRVEHCERPACSRRSRVSTCSSSTRTTWGPTIRAPGSFAAILTGSDLRHRRSIAKVGRVQYVESLIELVGNTPLLRLSHVNDGAQPLVLAKIEYLNPGGSVKDRIAVKMVEAAEREGKLKPGGTIVEPTSGNTGVGLATRGPGPRLSLRVRLPGQGQRGQAQRTGRVRSAGRGLPDGGRARAPGLLLLGLRPVDPRDRGRLEARPVQQPEQPGQPLRDHRSGDLDSRPTGRSPTSSPASAPAARSAAPAAT